MTPEGLNRLALMLEDVDLFLTDSQPPMFGGAVTTQLHDEMGSVITGLHAMVHVMLTES